jgi:hypothetical protein
MSAHFPEDEKARVRLSFGQLWHIYETFSGLVGAGSECARDVEMRNWAASALLRRGWTCPAIDGLKGVS